MDALMKIRLKGLLAMAVIDFKTKQLPPLWDIDLSKSEPVKVKPSALLVNLVSKL